MLNLAGGAQYECFFTQQFDSLQHVKDFRDNSDIRMVAVSASGS